MRRYPFQAAIVFLIVFVLFAACSETKHYRVLSFFFDGVPKPEINTVPLDRSPTDVRLTDVVEGKTVRTVRKYYPHTPYRENRCGGCHEATSGELVRSIDEGLCLMCHREALMKERYLHAPVAVGDCTTCHHYHVGPYPQILLEEANTICWKCHDAEELTTGEHHRDGVEGACVDCHNPHGGVDRFFLLPRGNR